MPNATTKLAPKELAVLRLAARGMTVREIGAALYISPTTVDSHLRAINLRLRARNRVHAVAIAILQGQIKRSDVVDPKGQLL